MKRVEIFVRHDAELDAFGYFQYIHEYNPDAAVRFLEAIDQTIEVLALQPFKGRLRKFRGRELAGVAFAFNGLTLNLLMWPSHIATFAWMPWVVLAVERAWREGGKKSSSPLWLARCRCWRVARKRFCSRGCCWQRCGCSICSVAPLRTGAPSTALARWAAKRTESRRAGAR